MKILKTKKQTKKKSGPPIIYRFDDMAIGNSFKIKCDSDEATKRKRISVTTAALNRGYRVSTRINKKIITVFMDEKIK